MAVLLGDLDGFKAVNDTYGHLAGDELLIAVAGRLTGAVRESDVVARFGGDEFAVLLDDLPGPDAAGTFAGRIVGAVDAPVPLAGGTARVGISVGFAVAESGSGTSVADLVGRADLALYAAKAAGKGTWREYAPGMAGEPPAPSALGEVSKLGFPAALARVVPPWPRGTGGGPRAGTTLGAGRPALPVAAAQRWLGLSRAVPLAESRKSRLALARFAAAGALRRYGRRPGAPVTGGHDDR